MCEFYVWMCVLCVCSMRVPVGSKYEQGRNILCVCEISTVFFPSLVFIFIEAKNLLSFCTFRL